MTDKQQIDKLESLAREAIRTATGEVAGTTSSGRALEALKEFRDALSPMMTLDLIAAWRVQNPMGSQYREWQYDYVPRDGKQLLAELENHLPAWGWHERSNERGEYLAGFVGETHATICFDRTGLFVTLQAPHLHRDSHAWSTLTYKLEAALDAITHGTRRT